MSFDMALKVVSALGVIGGIFFTAFQISESNENEIASLVYTIQEDGRGILEKAMGNSAFVDCVLAGSQCEQAESLQAELEVRGIIQFYSSVLNQKEIGALPDEFWDVWHAELCDFLGNPFVASYWKSHKDALGYSDALRREVSECAR